MKNTATKPTVTTTTAKAKHKKEIEAARKRAFEFFEELTAKHLKL